MSGVIKDMAVVPCDVCSKPALWSCSDHDPPSYICDSHTTVHEGHKCQLLSEVLQQRLCETLAMLKAKTKECEAQQEEMKDMREQGPGRWSSVDCLTKLAAKWEEKHEEIKQEMKEIVREEVMTQAKTLSGLFPLLIRLDSDKSSLELQQRLVDFSFREAGDIELVRCTVCVSQQLSKVANIRKLQEHITTHLKDVVCQTMVTNLATLCEGLLEVPQGSTLLKMIVGEVSSIEKTVELIKNLLAVLEPADLCALGVSFLTPYTQERVDKWSLHLPALPWQSLRTTKELISTLTTLRFDSTAFKLVRVLILLPPPKEGRADKIVEAVSTALRHGNMCIQLEHLFDEIASIDTPELLSLTFDCLLALLPDEQTVKILSQIMGLLHSTGREAGIQLMSTIVALAPGSAIDVVFSALQILKAEPGRSELVRTMMKQLQDNSDSQVIELLHLLQSNQTGDHFSAAELLTELIPQLDFKAVVNYVKDDFVSNPQRLKDLLNWLKPIAQNQETRNLVSWALKDDPYREPSHWTLPKLYLALAKRASKVTLTTLAEEYRKVGGDSMISDLIDVSDVNAAVSVLLHFLELPHFGDFPRFEKGLTTYLKSREEAARNWLGTLQTVPDFESVNALVDILLYRQFAPPALELTKLVIKLATNTPFIESLLSKATFRLRDRQFTESLDQLCSQLCTFESDLDKVLPCIRLFLDESATAETVSFLTRLTIRDASNSEARLIILETLVQLKGKKTNIQVLGVLGMKLEQWVVKTTNVRNRDEQKFLADFKESLERMGSEEAEVAINLVNSLTVYDAPAAEEKFGQLVQSGLSFKTSCAFGIALVAAVSDTLKMNFFFECIQLIHQDRESRIVQLALILQSGKSEVAFQVFQLFTALINRDTELAEQLLELLLTRISVGNSELEDFITLLGQSDKTAAICTSLLYMRITQEQPNAEVQTLHRLTSLLQTQLPALFQDLYPFCLQHNTVYSSALQLAEFHAKRKSQDKFLPQLQVLSLFPTQILPQVQELLQVIDGANFSDTVFVEEAAFQILAFHRSQPPDSFVHLCATLVRLMQELSQRNSPEDVKIILNLIGPNPSEEKLVCASSLAVLFRHLTPGCISINALIPVLEHSPNQLKTLADRLTEVLTARGDQLIIAMLRQTTPQLVNDLCDLSLLFLQLPQDVPIERLLSFCKFAMSQCIDQNKDLLDYIRTRLAVGNLRPLEMFIRNTRGQFSMENTKTELWGPDLVYVERGSLSLFDLETGKLKKLPNRSSDINRIDIDEDTRYTLLGDDRVFCCGGGSNIYAGQNNLAYILARDGRVEGLENMLLDHRSPGVVFVEDRNSVYVFGCKCKVAGDFHAAPDLRVQTNSICYAAGIVQLACNEQVVSKCQVGCTIHAGRKGASSV